MLGAPNMNFYEMLGVARDASVDAISKAFRKKAKVIHPDATGGTTEEAFKALSRAYNTLSDPDKRAHYDATGDEEGAGPRPPTAEEKRRAEIRSFLTHQLADLLTDDRIDPVKVDLHELLLNEVNGKVDQLRAEVKKLEKLEARLEAARVRWEKKTEGENTMTSVTNFILDKAQSQLGRARAALAVFLEAQEMLGDYTFRFDAPEPEPMGKETVLTATMLHQMMNQQKQGFFRQMYGGADS
jgi:curved DNA-binding protein CbpA